MPSLMRVALAGRCPRCGSRTLFRGWLSFAGKCSVCDLDFDQFNVGDGAAAFLIFIILTLVFIGMIVVEVTFSPQWWVQALIWVPITLGLSIGLLRIAKAALVASEYRNNAHQGKRIK